MFKVAEIAYISSTDYTFKFDKKEELGMITPSWTDRYPVRPGWTSFYLHLSPAEDSEKIISYINDIKPSLLLFLRQLRQMTISIKLSDTAHNKLIELARKDADSDIVILEDSRSSPERFLMVKHTTKTYTEEMKRMGIEESEIMLVFPLTDTGMPLSDSVAPTPMSVSSSTSTTGLAPTARPPGQDPRLA